MSYKINDLPVQDRPQEKLLKYGPEKLADEELLAIILRTGRKGENVINLSKKILKNIDISNPDPNNFRNISGLGPAKKSQIIACLEFGRRLLKDKKTSIYLSPEDVWKELSDITKSKKEHFFVLYLDSRNQEIKRDLISIGTLNASLVHPREVFESAVINHAASIMIAHNHPSNNPDPSEADIEITKKLAKSGQILGIELIDHVIVCEKRWFSFKENGLV